MTLYLYKTGTNVHVLTIENVQGYTADSVTALKTDGSTVTYAPLAEDCELSSKADCSETLRADWRAVHPSDKTRIEELASSLASVQSASAVAFVALCEVGTLDAVTASEHADLFAEWAYPIAYTVGQLRRYNGTLYKCVQAHTSQADWTPDTAVSLWSVAADPAEEWPAWSQPVGAHDAYSKNAKVSHNGKHWTSSVDNNVWEPGTAGTENLWTEATE